MSHINASLPPEQRARELRSPMTIEEKVAQMDMLSGVDFATARDALHNGSATGVWTISMTIIQSPQSLTTSKDSSLK